MADGRHFCPRMFHRRKQPPSPSLRGLWGGRWSRHARYERFRGLRQDRSALFALVLALTAAPPLNARAHAGDVIIAVTGVVEARGHVRVDLCTRRTFLTDRCTYHADAPAEIGSTLVTVPNVPPGDYAAQVFHDDTDQGVVHRNFFGVPRERIGFSNDARVHIRGPRFAEAAFAVGTEPTRITLHIRRLFHSD